MGYVVRRADLTRDRDAVVAVWSRNLASHTSSQHLKKFQWYYQRNPFGETRCWVLEAPGEPGPVGTAGLGVRPILLPSGGRVLAGLASDFAVDPPHRSLGPALLMARAVAATAGNGVDFIYGMPNSRSTAVFQRVGYDLTRRMKRYVKVLRSERFLREKLPTGAVRRPVAKVLDVALRVKSADTWRAGSGLRLTQADSFDERFDDLWARVSGSTGVAMSVRTSQFLRWRYAECPLTEYVSLAVTQSGSDRLAGYAVCVLQPDEQVAVVDLLVDPSRVGVADVLALVVRWARGKRASSVAFELDGAEELEAALLSSGFSRREDSLARAVLHAPNGTAREQLSQWYFLRVDEDYN